MTSRINNGVLAAIERGYAFMPRRRPSADALARARIISHRGECDNRRVAENTFAAFDPLVDSGVWGIEFDLRWTRDLEPVVCHDPDLQRVFGLPLHLAETRFATLRARCPAVPHLDEFIQRYARRVHLMLELKAEVYPDPDRQRTRLIQCLSGLQPGADHHVLSLEPRLFGHVPDLPAICWLPVARLNIAEISAFALHHGCAGLAGPFMALGRKMIGRHRQRGQSIGVGFPATRALLYREIDRGVTWLFSNRALRLQGYLDDARASV